MPYVRVDSLRKAAAIMRSVGNGNKASLFEAAAKEIESLQADIDSLMLEYCPEDMGHDQIVNWQAHQKVVTP